jgi:hypothetical protein
MSARQSPLNPIVWDDDEDFLPGTNCHDNGQDNREAAPSPPPSPSTPKELYLMCLRCPSVTMIEYERSSSLDNKMDCVLPGRVQLMMTICRTCLVNNCDYPSAGQTGPDLLHMMRVLSISPHYIRSTKLYNFLSSGILTDPHVIIEHGAVKYISLEKIIFAVDDTCTLKSMTHSEEGYIQSHLRGGFF